VLIGRFALSLWSLIGDCAQFCIKKGTTRVPNVGDAVGDRAEATLRESTSGTVAAYRIAST